MDILKMTNDYQKNFNRFYSQFGNKVPKKGKKNKRPNYLQEVVIPILKALPDAMPGYGFLPPTDDYVMFGEYYRVKGGIILYGGFSFGKNFELYFTPLFHGEPCGEKVMLTTLAQLIEILRDIHNQRTAL